MASIDELKGLISGKGGLARTNQFLIQIPSFRTLNIPGITEYIKPDTPLLAGMPIS